MSERYGIYMLGAVSGEDGPKTRELRAQMGDQIRDLGHILLSPHVAYDTEQTSFRESIGGLDHICWANHGFMEAADIYVAEGSGASEGRGYEIAYGLWVRKIPVFVFRHQNWGRGTNMLFGNKHPLLSVSLYNEGNLKEQLEEKLTKVQEMIQSSEGFTWRGV